MPLRLGLFVPPMAGFSEARRLAGLAHNAEEAGWDGLFLWDHILAWPGLPVADTWISLAAMAASTQRITIGPLVTPLARRRPWVLARQIATLDRLSNGRLVVGIGLGDDGWREFSAFGDTADPVGRGAELDESLDLVRALLKGEAVSHEGPRYRVEAPAFLPTPLQAPVPFWGACRWPHKRPVARAAGLEGIFPIFDTPIPPPAPTTEEITAVLGTLDSMPGHRGDGFEVVVRFPFGLEEPGSLPTTIATLGDAGATWILDSFGPDEPGTEDVEATARAGPPQLA